MAREHRDRATLVSVSEHLHYEVWMLSTLANALASSAFGQGALANAALESFTLHLRTLLDFFYSSRPKNDDVIAEDFFPDPSDWITRRPDKTELLEDVHRRVGKEVAHLTYVRLELGPDDKEWPFLRLANDLRIPLFHFLKMAPRHNLGPKWEGMIKQARDNQLNA